MSYTQDKRILQFSCFRIVIVPRKTVWRSDGAFIDVKKLLSDAAQNFLGADEF